MPFPSSDVNLTNLDLGTDSPATARTDLYDLASKFNLLRNFIGTIGQAVISAATKAAARSAMDAAEVGANTTITSIKGVPINKGTGTTTGNIAIGTSALVSNTTGTSNISVGDSAGFTNTTGVGNITIGASAGALSNGVNGAVYIGHNSGLQATGVNNTFVGGTTGVSNVAGNDNTFLGYNAGTANITGNGVTAVGSYALASTTTSFGNTAVGNNALFKTTGVGANNTAVGAGAGQNNTTASGCTFIGYTAGFSNSTGAINTALGKNALINNTTGAANTALGGDTLGNCSTGSGNIGLGGWTAALTYAPVFSLTTENNRIVMGSTAVTNAYVQVAWTAVSDARDKMDFTSVPHGLSFVNALQPISYRFRTSRGEDVPNGPLRYGFKAQDILALEGDTPVIIDNEDPNKLRMVDQHLIAVIVKAVQELSATVTAQAARIEALEAA